MYEKKRKLMAMLFVLILISAIVFTSKLMLKSKAVGGESVEERSYEYSTTTTVTTPTTTEPEAIHVTKSAVTIVSNETVTRKTIVTEKPTETTTVSTTEEPKTTTTEEVPEEEVPVETEEKEDEYEYEWQGAVLTASIGTVEGPSGKETWYNLDMSGVIEIMKQTGYDFDYWVREDGVKMYGEYIMVAADLDIRPRGTLVPTSLGMGMVCDTGTFIYANPTQLDIAVAW